MIKNENSQRTRLRHLDVDSQNLEKRHQTNGGWRVVDQSSHSVTTCYNLNIGYKFKCPYISI